MTFTYVISVVSNSLQPYGWQPTRLPSMGFSRQEYWSGLPGPPPGDLPDPGIEPVPNLGLLYWQAGSLQLAPPGKPNLYLPVFNQETEPFILRNQYLNT